MALVGMHPAPHAWSEEGQTAVFATKFPLFPGEPLLSKPPLFVPGHPKSSAKRTSAGTINARLFMRTILD
jgi:hypothetical protein